MSSRSKKDSSKGLHEYPETDFSLEDPTNEEWTNEKHSLYLNSMEALFVKHLYEQGYDTNFNGFLPRKQKVGNSSSSEQSNVESCSFYGEIKYFPEKLNLEMSTKRLPIRDESHSISESIQHYMSTSTGERLELPFSSFSSMYHQDSVGIKSEVSDQNFVDDDCKKSRQSSKQSQKRTANEVGEVSNKGRYNRKISGDRS